MPDAGAVGSGEGQPARIIRTDVAGGIRIRAIARPTEPGGLDPLLGGLVSAELAVAMAAKLTENTSRMATLMDFSARLRREAITADAQESSGDDIVSLGLPGGLGGRVWMPRHDHWQSSFAAGELTLCSPVGRRRRPQPKAGQQPEWLYRPPRAGCAAPAPCSATPSKPIRARCGSVNFVATTGEAFILGVLPPALRGFRRRSLPAAPAARNDLHHRLVRGGAGAAQRLVQSANTLIIAHPRHAPQKIAFTGTAFVLTPLGLVDGPLPLTQLQSAPPVQRQRHAAARWGFSPFVPEDAGRSVRVSTRHRPLAQRHHSGHRRRQRGCRSGTRWCRAVRPEHRPDR